MKKRVIWMLALLCAVAQGVWAQTSVSTEEELTDAIANGATNILLAKDIQLSKYLNINGKTVTIDLNGHKLSRSISDYSGAGHVIWAHGGSNLTLTSSVAGGSIEGGMANNGGAIHIPYGNTVTATNVIFQNNSARNHAGAIWNNGTFTATNCTFKNNTASDVGAIYNSVTSDGAGAATLTGCTFTGNEGTTGAGALANALGATVMTIDGCTIQDNTANSHGGGIWNGGTLNMKGKVTVTGNKEAGGITSNVFLKSGKVITVTGALEGSRIGVELEGTSGTFTSGYKTYNNGVDPATIFTADLSVVVDLGLDNGEACLTANGSVYYIQRAWDDIDKQVVSEINTITGKIAYGNSPAEGQYKEVTAANGSWFQMGGYSNSVAEYYVVKGNVTLETIVVLGKDVHLILCDNAILTLTGGLKLEDDNKLYIHSQSYGGNMGRLMVTNSFNNAAGIGSAQHEGKEKKAGELVIHGGHIEATGGKHGAGIGSCKRTENKTKLCNKVTVYGGYVKATGNSDTAGIGGGETTYDYYPGDGGEFILYDGTVIARGDGWGAGIGGGDTGFGGIVTIHGGTLTAYGGEYGAGIGGSFVDGGGNELGGGTTSIYGGTVTAIGGKKAAGIGGGRDCGGGYVYIYGGTVTATGGEKAAGIGGGYNGIGGHVAITGGTVIAKAGNQGDKENRAIGPGQSNDNYGTLTIGKTMMVGAGNNGSVERIYDADERVNACLYRSYAEISPCTHPSGITYTINNDGTHTSHCKHCTVSEKAAHINSDGSGTCICGYKDGEEYHTITIATSSNGSSYEGVGETVNVGNNKPYTLPVCSIFPDGYVFAGWAVGATSHNAILPILPNGDEPLLQAGENITITADVSIFARYQVSEISLVDNDDNGETLYKYNEKKGSNVILTGRTLYKDGNWNTLCLPFSLTAEQIADSPLAGADIRTLGSASFADATLTLNFTDAGTTGITAGTPYIVKWSSGSHIQNPKFENVTIDNTYNTIKTDVVSFIGIYSPCSIGEEGDNTMLYLGDDNKLYYPNGEMTINSCRAFFQLTNGLVCGNPSQGESGINNFVLNFGDDATGINTVSQEESDVSDAWYNIDGKRLNSMPTAKGIYIYKGRKVVK